MIYKKMTDLIGNTPVLEFEGVFIKLEYLNASGSVKDRAAKWMIEGLEKEGKLKPGKVIVEPTSGNTGISLAMIGALKGYKVVLIMPDTMTVERRAAIAAYGAEIVLTPGALGMSGAIAEANRLVEENGYVMPGQFDSKYNVLAHEESTAVEILNDFDQLDYVVLGIGTGGTISGISKVIRKKFPNVKIIGVEPLESPIISKGEKGSHGIQGIGTGFIPSILDKKSYDEVVTVSTLEAKAETKRLAEKGLFLGISSGAALKASYDLLKKVGETKKILAIAPDGGLKYLSTDTYNK
jgi:cysteine synthase A